ncbi:MAG: dipeptidase [Bdellovibrionales bacterium]|nr:dipeptidase [Bdellovibrionales bacterium]
MSENILALQKLYDDNADNIVNGFYEFLRFKSISTEKEFAKDVRDCANWVEQFLSEAGLHTEQWETRGHPVVFAQNEQDTNKPTVLIYNHYDVQPVDPLELWKSDPFVPTVRDGEVYARGAQDNKGQCWYVLNAIKLLKQRDGSLPVNIKLLIEGEEEAASDGLTRIVSERAKQLAADHLLIVDLGFHHKLQPAVTLGIRGIAVMTMKLRGSSVDLHSGGHGGIAYNPNRAMSEMLASLYDKDGKVAVPGFYDDIKELSEQERAKIDFSFDKDFYKSTFGAEPTGGESKYSPAERCWLRPTVEINGIRGGYTGDGFKTVIPAETIAKISCRLVPGQNPKKIGDLVADFLKSKAPAGITADIEVHQGGGTAVVTSPDTPVVQAAAQAYTELAGTECKFIMEGGSIPIVTELAKASGAEVVLLGYGLPGDLVHAPNEHFGLDRLKKGFVTIGRILELLGSGD